MLVQYSTIKRIEMVAKYLRDKHLTPKNEKIVVIRIGSESVKKRRIQSSLGRYVFGSEISYNKAPPRLPGLGC